MLSVMLLLAIFAVSLPGPAQAAGDRGGITPSQFSLGQIGFPLFSDPDPDPGADLEALQAATNARLQARVSRNRVLTIWGSGFNRRHIFIVKVRAGGSDEWKKVGRLRANRAGEIRGVYRLPSSMRRARIFRVCLKAVNRNIQICTSVRAR